MAAKTSFIPKVLEQQEAAILSDWIIEQKSGSPRLQSLLKEGEMQTQSRDFISALREATQSGNFSDIGAAEYVPLVDLLSTISRSRALQGFLPSETAMFVLSLKKPLFKQLSVAAGTNAAALLEDNWSTNELLDKLGLYTTEVFQKSREEIIQRQQREVLELSTPVVKLWEGILALPLIGTLDSERTQVVMESLLQKIVETGSTVAIIDITGVPTVDTLVAQHLIKTVTAAKLMGAECIISGIRPQIAQTIVHLGIALNGVTTKANLADAFAIALKRTGRTVKLLEKAPSPSRKDTFADSGASVD